MNVLEGRRPEKDHVGHARRELSVSGVLVIASIDNNCLTLNQLSKNQLWLGNVFFAAISILFLLPLPTIVMDNSIGLVAKLIYALLTSLIVIGQVAIFRAYQNGKKSQLIIDRETSEVKLHFGKKNLHQYAGDFHYILSQKVNTFRNSYQCCAVLYASQAKIYLHICAFSHSDLQQEIATIQDFLKVPFVESDELISLSELSKRYPSH